MAAGPILVSVVIPVYNSIRTLERCLDSVLAAAEPIEQFEIIVIDNGSTDGSFELLQQKYSRDAKISQIKGVTIAALRNSGARAGQGQYLSFIDSDCVVPKNYYQNVLRVFAEKNPDATGCKYDLPQNPHWIEETWQLLHRRSRDGDVNYLNAGNLIVKKPAFEATGGFDEKLVTDEDADLGWRLRSAGFRIYESHEISAVHLGNPKSLRSFFKKELWHGKGMFKLRTHSVFDKVLIATAGHFLLVMLGLIGLFVAPLPLVGRLGLLAGCVLLMPGLMVAYRYLKLGKVWRPFRSLLLYEYFFAAKLAASVARAQNDPKK